MTPSLTPDAIISRSTEVLTTELDDSLLMLNIACGRYHGLNAVAARIWALLEQPTSPAALVAALVDEYEVTPEECAAAVDRFLTELSDRDLLRVSAA